MQYCGFYLKSGNNINLNETICGYTTVLNISNPDIRDPAGGDFITFGSGNQPSLVCPAVETAYTSPTSKGQSSIESTGTNTGYEMNGAVTMFSVAVTVLLVLLQ